MEKMLITGNFSFSHSVFKGLVLQTFKNKGIFGKGLNVIEMTELVSDRVEKHLGKGGNGFLFPKAHFCYSFKNQELCGQGLSLFQFPLTDFLNIMQIPS